MHSYSTLIFRTSLAAISFLALQASGETPNAKTGGGTTYSGTVTGPIAQYIVLPANGTGGNLVFVYVSGSITNTPPCNTLGRFAFYSTTLSGIAVENAVIDARDHSTPVTVIGLGKCTLDPQSEDLGLVAVL